MAKAKQPQSYYVVHLPEYKGIKATYLTDSQGRLVWFPSRELAELQAGLIDWRAAEVTKVESNEA